MIKNAKHKEIIIITLGILLVMLYPLMMKVIGYECFWRKHFGITCAGCGFTRMIMSLLRFDLYQAFRYNPLFFILVIITLAYVIYVVICMVRKRFYYKPNYLFLVFLFIILLVYMLLRNTSSFSYLKPTLV